MLGNAVIYQLRSQKLAQFNALPDPQYKPLKAVLVFDNMLKTRIAFQHLAMRGSSLYVLQFCVKHSASGRAYKGPNADSTKRAPNTKHHGARGLPRNNSSICCSRVDNRQGMTVATATPR